MSDQDKDGEQPKYKITFAPGCFDQFDGSQEELDELIADIMKMAEDGTLLEQSNEIDLETLLEEDPEFVELLLNQIEQQTPPRKLQ